MKQKNQKYILLTSKPLLITGVYCQLLVGDRLLSCENTYIDWVRQNSTVVLNCISACTWSYIIFLDIYAMLSKIKPKNKVKFYSIYSKETVVIILTLPPLGFGTNELNLENDSWCWCHIKFVMCSTSDISNVFLYLKIPKWPIVYLFLLNATYFNTHTRWPRRCISNIWIKKHKYLENENQMYIIRTQTKSIKYIQ